MMLLTLLLCGLSARADIVLEGTPAVGEELTLTVLDDLSKPQSGVTVRVMLRKGLPGERDVAVGLTDSRGKVYWKPESGGISFVRTSRDLLPVHVAHAQRPRGTMVLMGLLVLAALGGLGYGLWPARRPRD